MSRVLVATLAALTCANVAQAQTISPADPASAPLTSDASSMSGTPLTLNRALELANVASPIRDIASANLDAVNAERRIANMRPNPTLAMNADNVFGNADYRGIKSMETSAAMEFPIERGGKRQARVGVANARIARAQVQSAIARNDLRYSVSRAYAEAASAEQRVATAQVQQRIAADALRVARLRVEAGRASPIEVQRAELARINADAQLAQSQNEAVTTRTLLSQFIGTAATGPLDAQWFTRIAVRDAAVDASATARSLVKAAADADVAVADANVNLARAKRYNDVSVGVGARYFRESGNRATFVSVSIPLPIFNNGREAVNQASAEARALDSQRRLAMQESERAIARAQADAVNASAAADIANGPALAAAMESARIARIGYREGKFSQLDLLEAERALAQTRSTAIDSLLTYHIAIAQLERLTAQAPSQEGNFR